MSGVTLLANGQWLNEVVYEHFALDAGADNGPTYDSADADMMPPAPVPRIHPSRQKGAVRPFGRFIVQRLG